MVRKRKRESRKSIGRNLRPRFHAEDEEEGKGQIESSLLMFSLADFFLISDFIYYILPFRCPLAHFNTRVAYDIAAVSISERSLQC
jgi:hypothetical protein